MQQTPNRGNKNAYGILVLDIAGISRWVSPTHVRGSTNHWHIEHGGKPEGSYETKESAFEGAVAAASLACRQGHEVTVTGPGAAAARARRASIQTADADRSVCDPRGGPSLYIIV